MNHELMNSHVQVEFGVLAACFKVREGGSSYCIIQLFEPMDNFGTPLTNEYDCPLLSLTGLFRCVSSYSVVQTVSIIHECTSTCTIKHVATTSQVERLSIESQKDVFVHDYTNNLFSLNIYCMHSSDLL